MYNLTSSRSNLFIDSEKVLLDTQFLVIDKKNYKTIYYNNLNNTYKIIDALKENLLLFLKRFKLDSKHIFIVGLGNDNHTADSIGPKVLKHIKVNSYLDSFIDIKGIRVSALEPGTLGETGIKTERVIKSVVDLIKPDLVILIDSFVSNNIDYLNKTIEINNIGINPGSGIRGINSKIDSKYLGVPVLIIGVPTAIEVKFSNELDKNYMPYLLSTKDIDTYVDKIAQIIGKAINGSIESLELYLDSSDLK